MLTTEQNERLTRVGPGTPMGELMPDMTGKKRRPAAALTPKTS